jgi:hypothetical protein
MQCIARAAVVRLGTPTSTHAALKLRQLLPAAAYRTTRRISFAASRTLKVRFARKPSAASGL